MRVHVTLNLKEWKLFQVFKQVKYGTVFANGFVWSTRLANLCHIFDICDRSRRTLSGGTGQGKLNDMSLRDVVSVYKCENNIWQTCDEVWRSVLQKLGQISFFFSLSWGQDKWMSVISHLLPVSTDEVICMCHCLTLSGVSSFVGLDDTCVQLK